MYLKLQLPCGHIEYTNANVLINKHRPETFGVSCYCEECNHTQTVYISKETLALIKKQVEEERHLDQLRDSMAKMLIEIENCVSRKIRLEIALSKTIITES